MKLPLQMFDKTQMKMMILTIMKNVRFKQKHTATKQCLNGPLLPVGKKMKLFKKLLLKTLKNYFINKIE